jgi:hypothetical protein
MISTLRYRILFLCLLPFQSLLAQEDTIDPVRDLKPPKYRELFHDFVDKQQKEILRSDGKADNEFRPTSDAEINFLLTKAVTTQVDWLQYRIEKDSSLNDQGKKKYLRGLEYVLKYYNANWRSGRVNPVLLPIIINIYEQCMKVDVAGTSIENIIEAQQYDVGMCIIKAEMFDKNPGFKKSQYILIRKYCALHPEQTLLKLRDNTDVPFLDSLIKVVAYRSPGQLYDFAASGNKLGYAIRQINDPLVSAVSKMATSRYGRWYFPFLDYIMKNKMTISDIDAVRDDSVKYYQLLVKTHLDYVQRAINKDTAYGFKDLEKRMETKARDIFVNTINGLHEVDNPAIRFKVIQPLSAEELYYVAVLTDGIIYTSSFVKGVYPLMMSKANQRGDSLLMNVKFDRYRKFIKMSAGYNTLSNFLSTFPQRSNLNEESSAEKLMRAFVSKLEQSGGLEDGVDVADPYASIAETIKPLADQMLENVKANYERNLIANNKRGIVMYKLLNKLFLSADTTNKIDLSKEFGIPPVYTVPFKALANDTGKVIMQVFFYGDKDGQGIFQGFKKMFDPKFWQISTSQNWITINSIKGKPVSIYANLPLPEENDEDKKAQDALDSFLLKNNLYPTIVIHRGHSYYAGYTIDQILPSAKIVFLGSCGGYHLIHDILKHSPDAHIIASKQIGKTAVNKPFFNLLMEKIRNGENIDWIPFWEELEKTLQKQKKAEGFEDYIPPYKNLGAIFIKAYKIAMGDGEE